MAYIRSPSFSNATTSRPSWKATPRCLVVTLSVSFIAFNWIVLHTLNSSNSIIHPDPPSTSTPNTASSQSSIWSGSEKKDDAVNFKAAPDWFANWIRWRGLDAGFGKGSIEPLRFDIVYTWVNGSDPDLQPIRLDLQSKSPVFKKIADQKSVESVVAKRFRDLDELRYSFRSIAQYSKDMYRHVHLLTTETLPGHFQVPDWLNIDQGTVSVVHHPTIFENKEHLPSFNSLAIESQMHNIPGISDIFMYLNDDVFFGTTILPSDVWTPLYGFVFHLEGSLLVPPTIRPSESNPINIGEWNSLQYSNYLLSMRFGQRYRAYLAHIPHVLSVPIMKEINNIWPHDMAQTSSHRFRGEGDAQDIQISFFVAHYVLEKLRETQLESFWRHRLDENQNGALEWSERKSLINTIESWNAAQPLLEAQRTYHTRPSRLSGHEDILQRIGVPLSGSTNYRLSGLDGYPFLMPNADTSKTIPITVTNDENGKPVQPQKPYIQYEAPQKRKCQLDLDFCFGSDFLDPRVTIPVSRGREIFNRLAFVQFHCGDCLLEILTQNVDTGVSAWMPTDMNSDAFKDVINKVSRYNYVLGTSEYSFIALQGEESAQKNLDIILAAKKTRVFFCINDDFPKDETLQTKIHNIFSKFLNTRFSIPSPWEKASS
ncbi:hypothetical protein BGZ76_001681 [Entomortierella beljakovae]|nr:hypothetical protein BGZ76_001681 [Entomortierella beljakovae]